MASHISDVASAEVLDIVLHFEKALFIKNLPHPSLDPFVKVFILDYGVSKVDSIIYSTGSDEYDHGSSAN